MAGSTGAFVWYELMTTDTAGAKAFYSEIIGWGTTGFPGMDGYELWTSGDEPLAGLMALPEEARKAGAPPHWMGSVSVDDVDATVRKAKELGATVFVEPSDIPDVGRFALLADPQGASFAIYEPKNAEGALPERGALRQFSWAELNTTDWESAWRFYSQLFGWKPTSSMDMGPEYGAYFMFGLDEKESRGGMSNAAAVMKMPPHWLHYINVGDVDEAAKRVEQKGGKVLNGPMDIPGGDRIAQCMDPQGAVFAIYSSGR